MPKFSDIRKFTKPPCYHVNVGLDHLTRDVERYIEEYKLQLNPDFQRGHVWNEEKQIAYIEFLLRGGQSAKNIYFNMPHWMSWRSETFDETNCMVLVDGKQRLEAIRKSINSEIPVFGNTYEKYEDKRYIRSTCLDFYVNDLVTRKEVLQWYLDLNTGGVVHTKTEIDKVKRLLENELT